MQEVDLERLVLPALLALLVLGAFIILVTSGGGDRPAHSAPPPPAGTSPARTSATTAPATATATAPAPPPPARRFVKVQPGDTPTSIAEAAGISLDRLLELNPSVDPSSLRPGQTLKLAP